MTDDALLIFVGVVQLAIGFALGVMYKTPREKNHR